jgi:cytoskeletal protein RodZ
MRWRRKDTSSVSLEVLQAQQLKEIGLHLQQQRQALGLSLDDMAGKTLIQRRLLDALESADSAGLPEPVYIRGFIQRYSTALGLDGPAIASVFPLEAAIKPVMTPFWSQTSAQLRPIHLYGIYAALVAASIHGLSSTMGQINTQAMGPVSAEQVAQANGLKLRSDRVATAAAGSQVAAGNASGTALDAAFPLAGKATVVLGASQLLEAVSNQLPKPKVDAVAVAGVQVKLTLKDESWLKVVVDGRTAFEGTMKQGAQQTWQGNQKVSVTAGNAGGVLVALNNQPAKPLGSEGQVQEVTYSPNQVAMGQSQMGLAGMTGAGLGAVADRLR